MGASAMTWETRADGVLAKTGHKVALFMQLTQRTGAANALNPAKPYHI